MKGDKREKRGKGDMAGKGMKGKAKKKENVKGKGKGDKGGK